MATLTCPSPIAPRPQGISPPVTLTCPSPMDPTRREDINVVIVMKAMGAESDQEIIQLVGEEESLAMLLMPTIQV